MSDLTALVEALRPRRKALAALWEAVTMTKSGGPGQSVADHHRCTQWSYEGYDGECLFTRAGHPDCQGEGRIPRDVAGWPAGAVRGALIAPIEDIPVLLGGHYGFLWDILLHGDWNDDAAALAAVLDAVRAVPEDGDAAGETK